MKRVTLLLFLLLACARGEEWISDQFRCAMNLPDGESWLRKNLDQLRLPSGEMVFNAEHSETKQAVTVVALTRMPGDNIDTPAIISRIMQTIEAQGYSVAGHTSVEVQGVKFLQFTGKRAETGNDRIAVARAILRRGVVFIVLTHIKGDEDRVQDKYFLRVINTFRLLGTDASEWKPADDAYFRHYQLGWKICVGAIGGLLTLFVIALLASRERARV